ncbi:MAG TPA: site-2 protease family protein, partial [Vicinamibacterales bacterium]|nr:site-2 protease family protein [Vicinamibacterales bacterium]
MTSLLAFVFVLGVLVFVHELGHFLAARRIGVRVITFSLGFGPKLLAFTRGDTEYAISAIPLGGYVKMAGENPEDTQTGAPDEFMSKSKWERFQVLVMGPVMNLGLAWLVMAAVLYQGAQVPAFNRVPTLIGKVTPNSAAEKAGFRAGDRIVAVDG